MRDTILVVDDDPETRRAVVRFVSTHFGDYETIEAGDGKEALASLSSRVALVVCDVNMPEVDGFELCRTLRNDPAYGEYADLHVIMLTSRDTEDDYALGVELGSTLYVPKPFDSDRLRQAIATVIGETRA